MTNKQHKNMFDNYESDVLRNQKLPEMDEFPETDRMLGSKNIELLRDISGNEIGVKAICGSAFSLYFTFDGEVQDGTLSDLLSKAEFCCEIMDQKQNTVLTTPVYFYKDDCMASIDLVSEKNGVLDYGNYYIYLYMYLDGIYYTLFSKQDGVISIE